MQELSEREYFFFCPTPHPHHGLHSSKGRGMEWEGAKARGKKRGYEHVGEGLRQVETRGGGEGMKMVEEEEVQGEGGV